MGPILGCRSFRKDSRQPSAISRQLKPSDLRADDSRLRADSMSITRRIFLRNGALAVVGTTATAIS